ncbi:MAG: carbon-nitrogen hydrolase family protein [Pseudomonadota bacterium]
MRLAAAAYPVEALRDWAALETKLTDWVERAASEGTDLTIFPEYAGMEAVFSSGKREKARTPHEQIRADALTSAGAAEHYRDLIAELARHHGLYLVAGSLVVRDDNLLRNRAYLAGPEGIIGWQDKCILTPWERSTGVLSPARMLQRFDLPFGRFGILICYDCEFPLLARKLKADVIAVPACTEDLAGQTRVQIAARARALESQCITLHAPLLGSVTECAWIDQNTGSAGIFGPPDEGFPADGILALSQMDKAGWSFATLAPKALRQTRESGQVALRRDWIKSESCALGDAAVQSDPTAPLK